MPKTNNLLTRRRGVSTNVLLTMTVMIAAMVIIGAALLFSGENAASRGEPVRPRILSKPDSHRLTAAPESAVTVVEFIDFQCPVCVQYYEDVTSELEKRYAGRVTFIARNYPLPKMHPLALPAARAAEAAGSQGEYKRMYDALYQNWSSWAIAPNGTEVNKDQWQAEQKFEQYAREIGLDVQRFRQDRDSRQVRQRIDQDIADGNRAGVGGTPTLFVNAREFEATSRDLDVITQQLSDQIAGELSK